MSEFLHALLSLLALLLNTRIVERIPYWLCGLPAVLALVLTRQTLKLGLYAPENRPWWDGRSLLWGQGPVVESLVVSRPSTMSPIFKFPRSAGGPWPWSLSRLYLHPHQQVLRAPLTFFRSLGTITVRVLGPTLDQEYCSPSAGSSTSTKVQFVRSSWLSCY